MDDLTILHLSDLHFDTLGAQPLKLHEALLADIKDQLKYSKNIVIAVTGDIVNQANYVCEEEVLYFFTKLKKTIDSFKQKVEGIFFVPGNHDKERSYATAILSDNCLPYNEEYYKTFWHFYDDSFRKYTNLTQKIYEIFFPGKSTESDTNATYGCSELKINEQAYIFVRFNTAWSATGNTDRRRLKLGEFQISHIEDKYRELRLCHKEEYTAKPPVVIAMAHHPINWLTGSDEDIIQNFLIGQKGIDAQIFLCGHTHTRDVINWSNNRQSLTTLSTGIGWSDTATSDHSELHAYSIYVLHLDLNTIDIYVRSTNDGGTFVDDYRLYTQEENKKFKKIVLPLSTPKVHSYIELGATAGRSPKIKFLANDFIMETERFIDYLGLFRQMAIQEMHFRKVNKRTDDNRPYLNFKSYLQVLCDGMAVNFLQDYQQDIQQRIRFHFRCLTYEKDGDSIKNISYPELCSSFWPQSENCPHNAMKTLPFSELIKAAFQGRHPLIFSANSDVCTTKTNWYNFITAIPLCEENIFRPKEKCNEKSLPILTFGVSIASEEFNSFLYCLDYYRIDRVLASILHLYAQEIQIDFLEFSKRRTELQ